MANPNHIAFILDGNGRWATKRGLPRNLGHAEGVKAVERTLNALCELKIPYASFFVFSTENWKRSKEEVDGLFNLAEEYFDKGLEFFNQNNIKVEVFGDLKPFPQKLQKIIKNVCESTAKNTGLNAGFCVNYGGKEDILQAINHLINKGEKNISAQQISANLYTKNFPDPDFVIRTSGEMRISNFMLWQMSYSELYFPKILWPDFNKKHLIKSLKVFSKRKRRFGGY